MAKTIRPSTLEELIENIQVLHSYYGPDDPIPYEDSICPTHNLFLDMAKRIIELENRLKDKDGKQ